MSPCTNMFVTADVEFLGLVILAPETGEVVASDGMPLGVVSGMGVALRLGANRTRISSV